MTANFFKNLKTYSATALFVILTACASSPRHVGPADGVKVGDGSSLKNMVPASQLEQSATKQYNSMKQKASQKNALAPENHPQVIRLRAIAKKILPHAYAWNPDSQAWKWEINLFVSDEVNAFCMPGGKIAFYTGILEKLKLNDDEVATVMGHEIAHALREHARDRIAKAQIGNLGANVLSSALGLGNVGSQALGQGLQILGLSFSRADEKDADLVGMDIAARAGYDPRAGVSLWQKMGQLSQDKDKQPEWLSTHPSGDSRIYEIQRNMMDALILYARAKNTTIDRLPNYKP
ncbi:MAG: M48 family metallopeptidase [Polynucleobacter victoriensis]|jgi:predicted Zn-dependent protease|uniref:Peptidase family M48 n=1 Tax=Polynucleobacter victoriensis TaxID=2049319 RepID=A0A212TCW4_9BURK|nr:M48 family metallopeptidase [Polynucleobacter victoriensis]SNC63852.1 Peptidase family M48 [Polynucleobacter victoriensis]